MKLLAGKNALVTGASKGIGRAIAIEFAKAGANVGFTYLSSVEQGEALEQELIALGVQAKGYRSDASNYAAAEELIKNFTTDFSSLDILVNNAGITKDNLLLRMSEEQWDSVMTVNLLDRPAVVFSVCAVRKMYTPGPLRVRVPVMLIAPA